MFFGDAQSESPRVPSPWINTPKHHGSARTSPGPSSGSTIAKGHSPADSPMSRSVRLKNAGMRRRESEDVAYSLADDDDESHSGSLTSTPLTEAADDVRIRNDEIESFFALDQELDALTLQQSRSAEASAALLQTKQMGPSRHLLRLAPEPDMMGNLEYKLRIIPPTRQRYDKLLTQLKWRLLQGGGECTYEIGLLDDGQCLGICPLEMRASVRVLAKMAKELDASVRIGKAFFVHDQLERSDHLSPLTIQEAQAMLLHKAEQRECCCGVSLDGICDTLTYSALETKDGQSPIGQWLCNELKAEVEIHLDDSLDQFKDPMTIREDVPETTFSLSLDEKATRAGLGFRRRLERKTCRYNTRNADSQKQYVTTTVTTSSQVESPPFPLNDTITPCIRVLAEVTLVHALDSDSFIDYASF